MSKYTAEQVPHMLRKAAKDAVNPQYRRKFNEAADIIDALLRERESAKASVTDEMVEAAMYACGGDKGAYWAPETYEDWRAALEAVAPMLASARVPDARKLRLNGNVRQQSYDQGWNACRTAMLAAATKPEPKE